jgi:hypothetical protein
MVDMTINITTMAKLVVALPIMSIIGYAVVGLVVDVSRPLG